MYFPFCEIRRRPETWGRGFVLSFLRIAISSLSRACSCGIERFGDSCSCFIVFSLKLRFLGVFPDQALAKGRLVGKNKVLLEVVSLDFPTKPCKQFVWSGKSLFSLNTPPGNSRLILAKCLCSRENCIYGCGSAPYFPD